MHRISRGRAAEYFSCTYFHESSQYCIKNGIFVPVAAVFKLSKCKSHLPGKVIKHERYTEMAQYLRCKTKSSEFTANTRVSQTPFGATNRIADNHDI